jgi:hypothetical protein
VFAGVLVTTVRATDRDTVSHLQYSIESEEMRKHWIVNDNDGKITVKDADGLEAIDYEVR